MLMALYKFLKNPTVQLNIFLLVAPTSYYQSKKSVFERERCV